MRNFARNYQIPTMYTKGGNSMMATIKLWISEAREDLLSFYRRGMSREEFISLLSCCIFIGSFAACIYVLKELGRLSLPY